MALFENFPYTDMHQLNLDWIIQEIKKYLDEKETAIADIDTEKDTAIAELHTASAETLENFETTAEQIVRDVEATIPQDYSDLSRNAIKASTLISGPYTSGTGIETIDSPVANTMYRLQLTSKPDWFPADYPVTAKLFYLLDVSYYFSGTDTVYRYIFDDLLNIRYRMYKQPFGSWSAWESYENASLSAIKVGTLIAGSPTGTPVESIDTLVVNTLYRTQLTAQPYWIPSNIDMTGIKYIIKLEYTWPNSPAESVLIFDESFDKIGFTTKQPGSSTWSTWYYSRGGYDVIHVPIAQDTITLQAAMNLAYFWGNTIVELEAGDYNIASFDGMGMPVGNNMHVIGTGKTRIVANSPEGLQYYSILMSGKGDYVVENIEFMASNIRYCVHDDPVAADAAFPATHIFKNCKFYINNDNNSVWPNNQCIGGGMGESSTIIIDGCEFSASTPDNNGLASYHNNASANAKGKIIVKNSYFIGDNGTLRASWYGDSTTITPVYIYCNSLGKDPIISAETPGSVNENIQAIKWKNEIRTAPEFLIEDSTVIFQAGNDYATVSGKAGYELFCVYNRDWNASQTPIIAITQQTAGSDNRIVFRPSGNVSAAATVSIRKIYLKK